MYTAKNSLIFQEPANEANNELILQYCTLVWWVVTQRTQMI